MFPKTGSSRRIIIAAVIAMTLLAASGVAQRAAVRRLGRSSGATPLAPGALSKIPMRLGEWQGRDVPLDKDVVRRAAVDDYVSRNYARGLDVVGLFVAYGVRARDLMPHRPEVCYPGAGYTMQESRPVKLALDDGSTLDCTMYRFVGGGTNFRPITVLNYYIIDGEYCQDVSLLRSKAWKGSEGVRYVSQVQVFCQENVTDTQESVMETARRFAKLSAAAVRAVLPVDKPASQPSSQAEQP